MYGGVCLDVHLGVLDLSETSGFTKPVLPMHQSAGAPARAMSLVCLRKVTTKGVSNAIDALRRWPDLQPHWPRIRRRICDQCGRRVALSEPRYLVCGGCGAARYCSEACQIANWGHHQTVCAALARQAARDGKASATAKKAAPFKARGVLKGVRNTLNSPFVHVDDF